MLLNIKKMDGSSLSVNVEPTDSVHALKVLIGSQIAASPNRIRLIRLGRVLLDSELLSDCSIEENATIHAVVRPESVAHANSAAAHTAPEQSPPPLAQAPPVNVSVSGIPRGGVMHISTSSTAPGDVGLMISQMLSALQSAAPPPAVTPVYSAPHEVHVTRVEDTGFMPMSAAPSVSLRPNSRRGLSDAEQTLMHCDIIRGAAARYSPQTPVGNPLADATLPGAIRSIQRSLAALNAPLESVASDAERPPQGEILRHFNTSSDDTIR